MENSRYMLINKIDSKVVGKKCVFHSPSLASQGGIVGIR